MYQAIGIIELKSIAKGIEATDAALKSAGVRLVSAHPTCPGKYEITLTGAIADVSAAVEHVKSRFEDRLIDCCVIGRIDPQVITGLFGTHENPQEGAVGIIETFSAASLIRAADIAVKTAKVTIYELRLSRGMGGKGLVIFTGDVGDVTASVEAGSAYAKEQGLFCNNSIIPAPHKELWDQLS
ncbi:MAG: BMC domain-containing protein [Clostridia bacterium]|nr:BMC domain-containing protein [Clostridia bacterium]